MARGELRIYLGAAPGVGKTYAMLNEGRRRRDRGSDVVVAYVETHGRALTDAQIGDLEVVPRRTVEYGGKAFEEMDLDAVLRRRPDLALVDELAHTNVPGTRNEKRWQDVEALLDAGISVISTVNIQHLESLNDVVAQITGVVQRETVPDVVLRRAEQVELVDMTAEALRRRMAHGNIYPADKVDAALANYFRLGNLGALRELALLWVADSVDDAIEAYRQRHNITETWETRERVVVALTGAESAERLIRRGARLASRNRAELVGVHIRPVDGLISGDPTRLERSRELLEELGGRYAEVSGGDVAEALVHFARAENATQIILGASGQSRWSQLTHGSIIHRVVNLVEGIDIHIISSDLDSTETPLFPILQRQPPPRASRARWTAWAIALVGTPLAGLALAPSERTLGFAGAPLVLLLGPVTAALLGGLAPAIVASVMGFVALDVLFVSPRISLRIAEPAELVTLLLFIAVSTLVSILVNRLATRTAESARERAESEALASLAQSTAILDNDALERLVEELRATLGLDAVAVLSPLEDGWRTVASAGEPPPTEPEDGSYSAELTGGTTLVVVGPTLAAEDRRLLSAFVSQVRLAQAALSLRAEAARAEGLADANELRNALLAAVSHDFRSPLANIKAAATSLTSTDVTWSRDEVLGFADTIDAEADRLTTLLVNLLDMSRLQAGMLGTRLVPTAPVDVLADALHSLTGDISAVRVELPDDLPIVVTDAALLERALANVINNALRWAPERTTVDVEVAHVGTDVHFRVVDHGPGIAEADRNSVFQPFQRLGDGGRAAVQGLGLGLAVTRGFCDAIGARITIDDTPGGGATVTIIIPLEPHRWHAS